MIKKKRLLLVTSEFPPQPGGIGNHAYNLAKHLDAEGFEVEVIADQRSHFGEEEIKFDGLLQFKVHRVVLRKLRLLMYFKRIELLFKSIKSSDVIIASGKFYLWSGAFSSLFFKRRYLAVIHGSEVNFTNPIIKFTINASLKRFSKLIAVSHFTKTLVAKVHSNVVVIPNGIDVDALAQASPITQDLEGNPALLTVGNVTQRKGQLNVIKQLSAILQVYPELHYHCVGLPTEKTAFLKLAESLHVALHITFHGRVTDEVLHTYLRSSDIFVMLSSPTVTGDVEGFGIAILEANALGLPAIGALGCGIEDAIADYQSGRLIPFHDTVSFINAINDIVSHGDHYERGAKDWALQHDWNVIVKRYIEVINED